MRRILLPCSSAAFLGAGSARPAEPVPSVPPLREQHAIRQAWLKKRLDEVLPALLGENTTSRVWIVANREYNEDPVFRSLVSPSQFAARRRTILVFTDRGPGKGVERLALGGSSNGGLYTVYRDPDVQTRELWGRAQWSLLRKVVDERKPASIALDISHTHAFSDGLSAGEREELEEALGPWTTRRLCARRSSRSTTSRSAFPRWSRRTAT